MTRDINGFRADVMKADEVIGEIILPLLISPWNQVINETMLAGIYIYV